LLGRPLSLNQMLTNPFAKLDPRNLSAGHTDDNLFLLINGRCYLLPVKEEEYFHGTMADALIAIHKRVVLN
jgi:hypothetical protein